MPKPPAASFSSHTSQSEPEVLFSKDFLLLCLSTFLFFASMFVILPILPPFIIHELHGTESQVGLIMGAFAAASILSRPASGRIVESRSRKFGLALGALIYCLAPMFYTFADSVPVILVVRFCHGAGIAFFTTASSVLVADLAPASRRGEAMGYFGMMLNLALACGPFVGAALVEHAGFPALFLLASSLGLASLAILPFLSEPNRPDRSVQGPRPTKRPPLLSRAALLPGCVAACMSMTVGSILVFLPLLVQERQLGNPGLYFVVFSTVVIITRPITGKWSDRFGRGVIIIPGLLLLAIAMTVLAHADSLPWLLSAAAIQGVGFGSVQPALFALGIDRSTEQTRGPVLATLMMALDLGHALSGIGLGLVLEHTNFTVTYLCVAGIALLGAGVFTAGTRVQRSRRR